MRIESIQREHSTLGILLDVTEETLEKRRIEHERDVDQLTGLFNRRAFYQRMDAFSCARTAGAVGADHDRCDYTQAGQ